MLELIYWDLLFLPVKYDFLLRRSCVSFSDFLICLSGLLLELTEPFFYKWWEADERRNIVVAAIEAYAQINNNAQQKSLI